LTPQKQNGMMKKLLFLFLVMSTYCMLFAQVRLDVEGDAKIRGKMDIETTNSSLIIGTDAGLNTIGTSNTFIGVSAGKNTVGNVQNTFVGASAGINNKGSENTFFGSSAGSNNILGTKNIFIGAMAGPVTTNLNKSMGIGYNAKVACDNCAVIGGTGVDAMKVGIGTDSPTDLLHVKGENARITTESISGFYAGVRSIESTGDYFAGMAIARIPC